MKRILVRALTTFLVIPAILAVFFPTFILWVWFIAKCVRIATTWGWLP